jgi:protein SCO1/2
MTLSPDSIPLARARPLWAVWRRCSLLTGRKGHAPRSRLVIRPETLSRGPREYFNRLLKAIEVAQALLIGLAIAACGDGTGSKTRVHDSALTAVKAGLTEPPKTVSTGMQTGPPDPTEVIRSFSARGVIREIPVGGQTVTVRHEEIPGFMPKMTMEFNVRDSNELSGFKGGETITFDVKANEEESWIENIQRSRLDEGTAAPPPDPASSSLLHVAKMKPGDLLPDAEFLAEDGRTIKLSDFQGRALAFTFIFTRCPLPDFCPRMNQHFSRARELLLKRSDPINWQFLSISFDPDFDQPGVLTRYAYSYRGENAERWLFAAAPSKVMASMSAQLDFRFANEGGSFVHNLRTVVLDPQRRVFRQFEGNRWKAEELVEALIKAAGGKE